MAGKKNPDRYILYTQLTKSKQELVLSLCLQLFWEKRLENLKFLNSETEENSRLPPSIKPVGPYVTSDTALQVILVFWFEHEIQCI